MQESPNPLNLNNNILKRSSSLCKSPNRKKNVSQIVVNDQAKQDVFY